MGAGVPRIARCLGRDEGLDEAVGEQADVVGQLRISTDHGLDAFVEALEVAIAVPTSSSDPKSIFLSRGSLTLEVTPLDRGPVVRQRLLAMRMNHPTCTADLKTVYSMMDDEAKWLV
jgi:hypothetical protein